MTDNFSKWPEHTWSLFLYLEFARDGKKRESDGKNSESDGKTMQIDGKKRRIDGNNCKIDGNPRSIDGNKQNVARNEGKWSSIAVEITKIFSVKDVLIHVILIM
ncbi:hypothetical protein SAMN05421736_115135 [Evansella caseinilytica]|uniref:Uncharacterized protein n=1 Tax=Evansella caseinilytica TaxID=1503961 RepID=A0A1H3TP29_9BACI|nr:hypothetical protein [Evansella caseinilytica]SDZ52043.1 hypothetical protein SAMN05421736_115135 [Evansella caseinilytica]